MNNIAKLLLKDGTTFIGEHFGAKGETIGELCFNTAMTGYQEILTDPSYCGQLITMTYPHIGNYGINNTDLESNKIQANGIIIKNEIELPSNFRSEKSLNEYLLEQNIVGIKNLDTRMLARIIRDKGSMNAIISSGNKNEKELINKLNSFPTMNDLDLTKNVSCKSIYKFKSINKKHKYKIAVIDFGIKLNILRILESYGTDLTIFPATSNYKEILNLNPDGIFLSNGPGDPSAVTDGIKNVRNLLNKKPIFGICLGHQILAIALGAKTYKMKFGHRGANHPVKNLQTNKIEITSQNHGFAIDPATISNNIEITHSSLNDNTIEGLSCKDIPAFSVQYHPESSPGPHDSLYLFERFFNMIKSEKLNENSLINA